MFYTDDNGNILDMRTPLVDTLEALLNDYYEMLNKMTAEQRMTYFKYEQFVEPLRYTQDIDNTTYIVRTHFDQNSDKTILQRVENIVEKDLIQRFKVLNFMEGYVTIGLSYNNISDCGKEQNE